MRVHLLSAYSEPSPRYAVDWLLTHGNPGSHELVDDPATADLIIFAETFASLDPYFFDVVRHPIFRTYPEKCVLHHNNDSVITFCRTVSPSVETWQSSQECRRSFHYIAWRRGIDSMAKDGLNEEIRYLFAFRGDEATHRVRRRILSLKHPEAHLERLSGGVGFVMPQPEREAFHWDYCRLISRSLFFLCPRGIGPASVRLFEVMQMGRVPVIISDAWKPVSGVPWDDCAIFVPEDEVDRIPEILESRRSDAEAMGACARRVWLDRFAPARSLERLIEEAAQTLHFSYQSDGLLEQLVLLVPKIRWRSFTSSLLRMLRHGRANWPL